MIIKVINFLPDLNVFIEGIVCFIVPFAISRFFKWISSLEKV